MSTNSLTYADVTGIRTDQGKADGDAYSEALKTAVRAVLDGFDTIAAYAYDKARRIAYEAVDHGNYDPILDQLESAYE